MGWLCRINSRAESGAPTVAPKAAIRSATGERHLAESAVGEWPDQVAELAAHHVGDQESLDAGLRVVAHNRNRPSRGGRFCNPSTYGRYKSTRGAAASAAVSAARRMARM